MLRCRFCGKIVEMDNNEAAIISQYGEKFAEREGMIRCDWIECDDCMEEREQEEKEREYELLMHEHELYDF